MVDAVKEGKKEAKTKLAWFLLSGCGGAEIDKDKAFQLLEERVEEQDSEAMWMLGLCYEYGMGCEQDIEKAELLYKRCQEAGNAVGEFFVEKREKNERGSGEMKVGGLC